MAKSGGLHRVAQAASQETQGTLVHTSDGAARKPQSLSPVYEVALYCTFWFVDEGWLSGRAVYSGGIVGWCHLHSVGVFFGHTVRMPSYSYLL